MNQRQDQHKLLIFNAQVHQAILKIVEIFLPLEISARDLDDKMLWEILCVLSVTLEHLRKKRIWLKIPAITLAH